MEEKVYWEMMFANFALIFTTYTITKDMVNENTVLHIIPYLYNSSTISAIVYAGILASILMLGLRMHLNTLTKQGKIN